MLHLFFDFVRYYFTRVFNFLIYAYYFSIRDCNTFGGNMIPYRVLCVNANMHEDKD